MRSANAGKGTERVRGLSRDGSWVQHAAVTPTSPARALAVLFDRDGTLVVDVPYNSDPSLVEPMPTALSAVRALREAGVPLGVVSNQSGVAPALTPPPRLTAGNARVKDISGPSATGRVCPHRPEDECRCRKPRPGLVLAA